MLGLAAPGATLLLNCTQPPDQVWDALPRPVQEKILAKRIEVYAIDAGRIARDAGLAGRTNTVLQTCFFAISGVLPREEAIAKIKSAIAKTYGRRGAEVVARNHAAVDAALAGLHQVPVPGRVTSARELPAVVPAHAPEFVRNVTAAMMAGRGDELPVSALPVDGTYPSGTAAYEKRNISELVAQWDPDLCIQCGNCSFVCPHSVIRSTYYDESLLAGAPSAFLSAPLDARGLPDTRFTLQVLVEDCTGCELCVQACPVAAPGDPARKAINLAPREPLVVAERENIAFFETLPVADRSRVDFGTVRGTQFLQPLFEFSGACAGCGETPYIKILSQLFGDRLMVANATGCSSIYGGNLPTTPWTTGPDGRGPAWSNSLFEDNAEFGLGFRLTADRHTELARKRLAELPEVVGAELAEEILGASQLTESELRAQHDRVAELKRRLDGLEHADGLAADLRSVVDHLVRRSVWIVGGDGWAYDIGSGGLDHVLASGRNVNVLVLDTEVYSNTGGQSSKATPLGAVAKFAAAGKTMPKKDLALQAIALRVRVRRAGGDGRRPAADLARFPGGGGLRRAVADHRLQPLHRAWHRDARRSRPAVPRRGQRLLAAGPLRPAAACGGRQPVPARLAAAAHPADRLHPARAAVPRAQQYPPGRGRTARRPGPGSGRPALGHLRGDGDPRRAPVSR